MRSGEQRPQAVLLLGRREVQVAQTGVERRDVREPRPFPAEQVIAPPAPAVERGRYGEDPARRHACAAPPQVTAGHAQQLPVRAGQGGEQLAVLALDALAPQWQLPPSRRPFVVGEQRVVADRPGEGPLGQAQDDDQVEVQADAHRDRADEDAFPEAADPSEVGLQLQFEGPGEHVEPDRSLDGVERGQAIERCLDPFGGLGLRRRPAVACVASRVPDQFPRHPPGPARRGRSTVAPGSLPRPRR